MEMEEAQAQIHKLGSWELLSRRDRRFRFLSLFHFQFQSLSSLRRLKWSDLLLRIKDSSQLAMYPMDSHNHSQMLVAIRGLSFRICSSALPILSSSSNAATSLNQTARNWSLRLRIAKETSINSLTVSKLQLQLSSKHKSPLIKLPSKAFPLMPH